MERRAHFNSKLSQAIKDDVESVRDALPSLQANTVTIRDSQSLQLHETIMKWLSPTDFPAQQHDIISKRQDGTGEWFLNSMEFKRWLDGADNTLFCPGIPGAGKTMMAAVAVDHLRRITQRDNIRVACIFCSYKAQADQSEPSLVAALLKQLVQSNPDIAVPVQQMYDNHSKQGSRPSLNELLAALKSVCLQYAKVYVVVDALDEHISSNGRSGELIDNLRELQAEAPLRLLFTSRFIPEIMQKFQSDRQLAVRASEEDVRRFVVGQIPRLPNCIRRDEELRDAVETKVVEAVDGMYVPSAVLVYG
jgi:Cdc6-like AAA superfamily ATPase